MDSIADALRGKHPEVPPAAVFTQSATVTQMDRCGAAWPEANYDPSKMAELALELNRSFGFPTVRVPFSITAEAQALGCEIKDCGRTSQPMAVGSPWRKGGPVPDVPDMPSAQDFLDDVTVKVCREASEILARNNQDLFRIAGVNGPLSVVSLLLGAESMVMTVMTDRPLIERWVGAVQPLIAAEAASLGEIADDVQVTDGLASPDILPPDEFDTFCGKQVRPIFSSLKSCGTLHICGDATAIVGKMAGLGADGISIDVQTDTATAVREAAGKAALIGGVGPVIPLFMGTPEQVVSQARESAEAGYSIIAPGCGVPPSTPDENLAALAQYAEGWAPQRR
jgi:[methyl-Co(III) methanol-specific corrinoid protein]:coenzyme M methyltransferase